MVSLATFTLLLAGCAGVFAATSVNPEDYPFLCQVESRTLVVLWGMKGVGSILTKRHILTSAKTVSGLLGLPILTTDIRCRTGATQRGSGGTTTGVQKITIHPDYNNNDRDVALLRLVAELTYNLRTQPIGLPNAGDQIPADVIIPGVGSLSQDVASSNSNLYMSEFTVTDRETCASNYSPLTDNMFCVVVKGTNAANWESRDIGSPIVGDNKVIGIASAGSVFANKPVVANDIESALTWINANIAV